MILAFLFFRANSSHPPGGVALSFLFETRPNRDLPRGPAAYTRIRIPIGWMLVVALIGGPDPGKGSTNQRSPLCPHTQESKE